VKQRFASTNTELAPAATNVAPNVAASPTGEWAPVFDDLTASAIPAVEPYIGFLKDMGVNFGYGSTSIIQWLFEHLHVYSGLPWWGSITLGVLIGRVAILPLVMQSADASGRMAVVSTQTKEIQARMKHAQLVGDKAQNMKAMTELKQVYSDAGVKLNRVFLPILLQIPLGFGIWRLTQALAHTPVPGVDVQGTLWFPDLTVHDPYFIMPATTGLMMYLAMKVRASPIGCINTLTRSLLARW
jgi:YidC/Oxa1 family membrane protein insertase